MPRPSDAEGGQSEGFDWLVSLTEKGEIACEWVNPLGDGSERSRRGDWRRRTKDLRNCKNISRTTEPRLGLKEAVSE